MYEIETERVTRQIVIPSLNLLESVAASELSSSVKSSPEIWTHTREELKILRPDVYIDTTHKHLPG